MDPAAQALLGLLPFPNQPGDRQNYHFVSTTTSHLDDLNVRLVHIFGEPPQPRGRGQGGGDQGGGAFRGGPFGGGGGFGGGRGGGRQGSSNLNLAIHFRRSDNSTPNAFETLGGNARLTAWDMPVDYSFTKAGLTHSIRFQFNRQHSESQNLFAFNENVAGNAGLQGISPDPFDWGAPGLSFSTIASVRDLAPSTRTDQTIGIGDTVVKTHGQHTVRFGGDLRAVRADSRADPNANGSYVFTGLYTGSDFGDFLLGLPQQASVQYGPGTERFRQHTADAFLQDDWRLKANLTINAGIRYEDYSPLSEADNRLVTLDAPPGFTAASPVIAGGSGPFSGPLPATLVRPFRGGLAPRVGLAWRCADVDGRSRRLRHQLQLERLPVDCAAARGTAAFCGHRHDCWKRGRRPAAADGAPRDADRRHHEQLRHRSELPVAVGADLERRRAARLRAHCTR